LSGIALTSIDLRRGAVEPSSGSQVADFLYIKIGGGGIDEGLDFVKIISIGCSILSSEIC
jgi:hypothetical protein